MMKTTKLLGAVTLTALGSIATTFACIDVDYSQIKEGDPVPNNACAQTQKTYSTKEAFIQAEEQTCETATDGVNTFFGKDFSDSTMIGYPEDFVAEWSCLYEKNTSSNLSDNDANLKKHIENRLDEKNISLVQSVLKRYETRLETFSDTKKAEINKKVILRIDAKISDLLGQYPQDIAIPKKANELYLTLQYLELSLMELDFENSTETSQNTNTSNLVEALTEKDIATTIPKSLGKLYAKNFVKYTAVTAPNGKNIHIVAQDKISDEQILRAKGILEHYLRDFAGSIYGADKLQVANKMADNNAVLALLNGEDNGENKVAEQIQAQPLYQNEMQTEGGDWYVKQNYEHRDASYEEILHFVHDYGIGVDGNDEFLGALPAYQAEIRTAQKNALTKNLWGRGAENKSWIQELSEENSLTQEYLASVIDSYYGLWGAWDEGNGGMWDIYIAKTRSDIKSKDTIGYKLLNNTFFHPYITYNARIEPSFAGTFSLKYDNSKPYTNHSQYLKDITLLGNKNTSVVVNNLDNYITGNEGNNTIIFSGKSSEYIISKDGDMTIVEDTIPQRDGKNMLKNSEIIQFSDGTQNTH